MAGQTVDLDLAVGFGLPRRGLPAARSFRTWIAAALAGRQRRVTIALRLVDEAEGRQLNRQFRGRDYATNVLSFPAELATARGAPRVLGDIAICAPVVRREAAEQGKPARAHFAHLSVHAALHLTGLDHGHPAEAEAMEAIERKVLAGLGFPDPYR